MPETACLTHRSFIKATGVAGGAALIAGIGAVGERDAAIARHLSSRRQRTPFLPE